MPEKMFGSRLIETFESEGRKYSINPERISSLVFDLAEATASEALRRRGGGWLTPMFGLKINGLHYDVGNPIVDLSGSTITIKADRQYGESARIVEELGKIVVSSDRSSAEMTLEEKADLVVDPSVVYRLAERYSL